MTEQPYVLSTKLVPPRVKAQCLSRKRLDELFCQVMDYPVTLLQADAGYGKSTALVTHVCTQFDHLAWYSVEIGERDMFLFLHYLIHACQAIDPLIGERSLRLLQEVELTASVWQPCLTLLLNDLVELAPEPTILVLDDFHTVSGVQEIQAVMDHLIRYLPAHVHLVIGSRRVLELSAVKRLRSTFDLLVIDKRELAFTTDEIEQLFQQEYGIVLPGMRAQELHEQTEGWIIALQLVWKGLERGVDLANLWRSQPETGRQLFHYLAEEVFDRQPEEIQTFLSSTCMLETMELEVCNLLVEAKDSADILQLLERNGLFVTGLGNGQYRYHRLFRGFLIDHSQAVLSPSHWSHLHRQAAHFYQGQGELQAALHHFFEAGDLQDCVHLLLHKGVELLQNGRVERMKHWIDRFPTEMLEEYPQLLYWRGEIDRISSRFHEAEHWYNLAEGGFIRKEDRLGRSYVYRGQAQVFLDTIQPRKATHWLQKAVQILGDDYAEETAQILRLLAENHTNSGQLQMAEEMVRLAEHLVPGTTRDELDIRIHLRTGRLQSAREMTLAIIEKEQQEAGNGHRRIPKSHREMHLLLSLIDAFLGEADSSRWHAEQGILMGQEMQSPFVEAVGYMRLGHAYALAGQLEQAQEFYQISMQMSDALSVERGKVEALMGLCITSGLLGEMEQAEVYARTGYELALNVQDLWCANLIRLAIGSIWTAWGHFDEALPWLLGAEEDFGAIGDPFCLVNVRLWLSVLYHSTEQDEKFADVTRLLLRGVEEGGYQGLFLKRTLFGPCDLQITVPSLIEARDRLRLESAEKILRLMGCRGIQHHPGFTLRIHTLGSFTVYRGMEEVGRKEWKREKSRQLFQLLVTRNGQFLQRDEIYDLIWPEVDEKTANRDFKVAMNALANALEPSREARSDSFFIERIDTAYRLNPNVAIWIDAHEFRVRAEKGLALAEQEQRVLKSISEQAIKELEAALVLYKGDFLQHVPYLDWCADERERIRSLYLRVLEQLGTLYQQKGLLQEAVACCEKLLDQDSCWEVAYQILMTCFHQLGNRKLIISTYKKCMVQLEEQLALAPLPETTKLYQRFVRR